MRRALATAAALMILSAAPGCVAPGEHPAEPDPVVDERLEGGRVEPVEPPRDDNEFREYP